MVSASESVRIDPGNIRECFAHHQPRLLDPCGARQAAVALVLSCPAPGDVRGLFIERARRADDPWSGQMALPGGMVEASDADGRLAARRETAEEVGLDLHETTYLGRMDDMEGSHAGHPTGIVVSGFVFQVPYTSELTANYEVADTLWVPLAYFFEPARYTVVPHPLRPEQQFPGIRVGKASQHVVWGLTRRFLCCFFEILDLPFRG